MAEKVHTGKVCALQCRVRPICGPTQHIHSPPTNIPHMCSLVCITITLIA